MKKTLYSRRLVVLVILSIFLAIAFQFVGLLVPEKKATDLLEAQGYSNIEVKERVFFFVPFRGGANDDVVRFEVGTKNPSGDFVVVYIYSGWPFKGATLRSK